MNRKLFLVLCLAVALFSSCKGDKTQSATTAETTTENNDIPAHISAEGKKVMREMGDLPREEEYLRRLQESMDKIMLLYSESAKHIEGFSNPDYSIDEKCNIIFTYEENGSKYEKHFNGGDLDYKDGKMTLAPEDGVDVKYPGFRIATADGETSVKVLKDGKQIQKDNEWYVILHDRPTVEKAAPTVVNLINICHEIKSNN